MSSVFERVQRCVRCAQFNMKTVPHPKSLDSDAAVVVVRSGTRNSQLTGVCEMEVAGCGMLTLACNIPLN